MVERGINKTEQAHLAFEDGRLKTLFIKFGVVRCSNRDRISSEGN